MASFNYYLKDTNVDYPKTKPTAIYLLFDDGQNRAKMYIQQSIASQHWNFEAGKAGRRLPDYCDFNEKLKQLKDRCEALHITLTKDGDFTLDRLKEEFKAYVAEKNGKTSAVNRGKKKYERVIDYYQDYMTRVSGLKSKSTLKSHKTTVANLTEFEKRWGKQLTFARLDLEFYHDFMDFTQGVKKYRPNSIGKFIKNIKVVLNDATELGINTNIAFKSRRFQAPAEDVDNIYLDTQELEAIYEFDFGKDKRLDNARDLFLIGCWTGLRYSDFSQLTKANFTQIDALDYVSVKTQKTAEKVMIPLHPTVKAILAKYTNTVKGFPRKISGQRLNDYLKDIGEKVGINTPITVNSTQGKLKVQKTTPKYELICTHTARRSFATNLYRSGLGAIHIMRITGHKTEKSFMTYIKISTEENALKLHEHWTKTNKLKVV
jgi:integrase